MNVFAVTHWNVAIDGLKLLSNVLEFNDSYLDML